LAWTCRLLAATETRSLNGLRWALLERSSGVESWCFSLSFLSECYGVGPASVVLPKTSLCQTALCQNSGGTCERERAARCSSARRVPVGCH
jgi:hypothetical protein